MHESVKKNVSKMWNVLTIPRKWDIMGIQRNPRVADY